MLLATGGYDTLQELAEGEGIDAEGLLEEVERFNGFCETGVDLDFLRGEVPFSRPDGVAGLYSTIDETLPNPMLGKVETGPFYAVRYGMGSFGTSGGLAVDEHARVLKNGEPIPGLYACGCTAAGYSGYMGAGVSNGSGMHRGMRAADDALQLGVFPD